MNKFVIQYRVRYPKVEGEGYRSPLLTMEVMLPVEKLDNEVTQEYIENMYSSHRASDLPYRVEIENIIKVVY